MQSLAWKVLTPGQVRFLRRVHDLVPLKIVLAKMLDVPVHPSKLWTSPDDSLLSQKSEACWDIITELYLHLYAFAKQQLYTDIQISTCMALVKKVIESDLCTPGRVMSQSFDHFKTLLFHHSLDRQPTHQRVFDVPTATELQSFLMNAYFRQFRLFQYNFTKKLNVTLLQTNVCQVMEPPKLFFRPLCEAMQDLTQNQDPPAPTPAKCGMLHSQSAPILSTAQTRAHKSSPQVNAAELPLPPVDCVAWEWLWSCHAWSRWVKLDAKSCHKIEKTWRKRRVQTCSWKVNGDGSGGSSSGGSSGGGGGGGDIPQYSNGRKPLGRINHRTHFVIIDLGMPGTGCKRTVDLQSSVLSNEASGQVWQLRRSVLPDTMQEQAMFAKPTQAGHFTMACSKPFTALAESWPGTDADETHRGGGIVSTTDGAGGLEEQHEQPDQPEQSDLDAWNHVPSRKSELQDVIWLLKQAEVNNAESTAQKSWSRAKRRLSFLNSRFDQRDSLSAFSLDPPLSAAEQWQRDSGKRAKKAAHIAMLVSADATLHANAVATEAAVAATRARFRRGAHASYGIGLIRRMQQRVDVLLEGRTPLIKVDLVQRQVILKEQLQFESGGAKLHDSSRPLMQQICEATLAIMQTNDSFNRPMLHLRVEGHVHPTGNQQKCKAVSRARALQVCRLLSSFGICPEMLHPCGYGGSKPIAQSFEAGGAHTASAAAKLNRRVEIHVLENDEAMLIQEASSSSIIGGDLHSAERLIKNEELEQQKQEHMWPTNW